MFDSVEQMHSDLVADGYRDIEAIGNVKVGSRVHHVGERSYEAYESGTAVVRAILEKSPSEWSAAWGRRDIELIIELDKPLLPGMSRLSQWAQYHTCIASAEAQNA